MAEQKTYMGQTYTRNGPGEPWVLVPAAPSGGRVVTLAPNPEKVAAAARQAERDAATDAERAADNARADRAAERADREWAATHNPDGSKKMDTSGKPMPDGVAKRYEDAINAFAAYDRALGGFADTYAGNTWTGELENKAQNLLGTGTPGQAEWWADFRTADNQIRNALFGASLTAGEKAAYAATTVTPSMTPDRVRENLERRRALAADVLARRTAFLKKNGYNPEAVDALAGEYLDVVNGIPEQRTEPEIDPVTGATRADDAGVDSGPMPAANEPGGNDPTPPPQTPASGRFRYETDPRMSAQIDALINAGASEATINSVLKQQNFPPLELGAVAVARKWMEENPGKSYFGAKANREIPLNPLQQLAGSPTGAFLANAANFGAAGIPAAMAGDTGKGALDAMRAANPDASFWGTMLGGVTGSLGAEALLAARAPAAVARFVPRAADAAYGATLGFNEADEGEGGSGALTGAAAGLAGGLLGQGAARAAGATLRGVTSPAVNVLRDRGIPLTVGQTVGDSGRLGAAVKKIEDSLTSVPFVGNMVDARRIEGLEAFNRAAFQDAAAPGANITATGAEGLGQVRQSVSDAYDQALLPAQIDTLNDPQMVNDLALAQLAARNIPNVEPTLPQDFATASLQNRIMGGVDPNTGTISGRNFQEAYRGLARDARGRANSDFGHEIGQVTRQGQDLLGEALERQNPGAFDGFLEANAAHRRANVLAQAINPNATDELITPAQLNRADFNSTSRLEGKVNAASGNRPFYELANAGQAVLPSKLPDSGTTTRALTGLALTGGLSGGGAGLGYMTGGGAAEGAGAGSGLGLAASLALMAGGTRGGQALMRELLLSRPDVARAAGEALQRNARIGSGFGAGILTPLTVGP